MHIYIILYYTCDPVISKIIYIFQAESRAWLVLYINYTELQTDSLKEHVTFQTLVADYSSLGQ